MPALVLWAWERPENLSFIDVRTTGVASLEGTAVIAPNGSVAMRMRTQSLAVPAGSAVLAVVRVETSLGHAPLALEPLLSELAAVARLPNISGIQIDFDARRSERSFYQKLLEALAERTSIPISITALASWCEGDRWVDGAPVAEAVPMFFRMGVGESRDMRINSPLCRSSIGLSLDEPWPMRRPVGIQRVYLFDPQPWTPESYARAVQSVLGWR